MFRNDNRKGVRLGVSHTPCAVGVVGNYFTSSNDKVLTIEMTEKQISGRNISLNIDYEDVLSADSFNSNLLEEE